MPELTGSTQRRERRLFTGTRRGVFVAGAAALPAALLAACGATAGGGQAGAGGAGTDERPAAQRSPVSIEVLTRNGVTSPTGHSQFYARQARAIFTPETNITVNFVDAQPNVGEKLTIMAAGGTVPDVAWFGVVADGNAGPEQATKGIFKPLNDVSKKDTKFDLVPYFKAMLDAFSIGGKLYALPTHAHYGTNVLYYNKNMTDGLGIRVPDDGSWTHEDLVAAAQKLTRREEDTWGYWPSWGFSEHGTFWVRQFGGEFLDVNGKTVLIDSQNAREAFEFVHGMQSKHQVIDNLSREVQGAPLGLGGNRGLFALGKLAMHNTTPGLVAEYRKPNTEEVKFPVGIALFPKHASGRRGTQASGSGMGITDTKKLDAGWEYVKFATNKLNGIEQVFGGAGSPGGRTDVWTDPKLLAFDPIYNTIVKAFPQGAGSLRLASNFRYAPMVTAVNAELTPYFQGQVSVQDATSRAVQAGNAELNR
jgi:ABC-type glycerol-3-phosphate transport system substrate-binding protein